VRFEIENKPSWLAFVAQDGRLTGIPTDAATGIYDNIRIWVTDGVQRVALPLFSIRVRAADARGQVSLRWTPPLENNDGSALTDLAGYRIYAGRTPTTLKTLIYIRTPAATRWFINSLESGYHFFAITAVNSAGIESIWSYKVTAHIP
jgi:hypothetical protein